MISHVSPEVLERNPGFHALYKDLVNNKLNLDGSTRAEDVETEDKKLDEELKTIQKDVASTSILKSHLTTLSSRSRDLPSELREVIDISVSQSFSATSATLRATDVAIFTSSIPQIASILSTNLLTDAITLITLLDPTTASSTASDRALVTSLPTTLAAKQASIGKKILELGTQRKTVLNTLSALLGIYNTMIETLIKLLELSKLGLLSRATRAHAKHLALVTDSFLGKLRILYWETLEGVYTPQTVSALGRYGKEELGERRVKGRRKKEELGEVLEEWEGLGKGGERLVGVYQEYLGEMEKLKEDIKRMGSDV